MTNLQIAWFAVLGVVAAAYAILDGFDLGVGIVYPFIRDREHRGALHDSISPVWDGNEVWLIIIGGLIFAIFPAVYAMVLSGFYILFMLILFGLISRSAALGLYYSRAPGSRRWVFAFSGGSILAGFFLGLVAGNLIRGVALDAGGNYAGSLGSLFNPFAVVAGLFALTVFANQGAAWAAVKTTGEANVFSRTARMRTGWIMAAGFVILSVLAVFLVSDHVRTVTGRSYGWVMIALVLAGLVAEQGFAWRGHDRLSFAGASATVVGSVGIWASGVYPSVVPAANDAGLSLTISSAAAPHASLIAMVVVAAIGIPLATLCAIIVYRAFRGRQRSRHEGY